MKHSQIRRNAPSLQPLEFLSDHAFHLLLLLTLLACGCGRSPIPSGGEKELARQMKSADATPPGPDGISHFSLPLDAEKKAILACGPQGQPDLMVVVTATSVAVYQPQSRPWRPKLRSRLSLSAKKQRDLYLSRHGRVIHLWLDDAFIPLPELTTPEIRVYTPEAVHVRRQKRGSFAFADDFMREKIGERDGWTICGGTWQVDWDSRRKAAPNAFTIAGTGTTENPAELTAGYWFWGEYQFSAAVYIGPNPAAGGLIFGRTADNSRSFKLLLRHNVKQDEVLLLHRQGPKWRILFQKAIHLQSDNWYQLGLDLRNPNRGKILLDGFPFGEWKRTSAAYGEIGLTVPRGRIRFDDVSLRYRLPAPPALSSLRALSRPYSAKPRYTRDNRDNELDRWAKDADAWQPESIGAHTKKLNGYEFHLPLYQNFAMTFAAGSLPLTVVFRDGEGKRLPGILIPSGSRILSRSGAKLLLDGAELAHSAPWPHPLTPGCYRPGPLFPRRLTPKIRAAGVYQELFQTAPTNWLRISGTWKETNRWRCQPKWGFFGGIGPEDVVLISKSSFSGNQTHEFYFGMKDIFGRQYKNRRYARHDVNFSFMMNGRDLFSGYTVLFGAFNNRGSYLFRGEKIVARNMTQKFPPFVNFHDLHLLWRRFRVEAVNGHLRVLLDKDVLFDYQDPDPKTRPSGGQIALWTHRNGLVYARIDSTAEHSGMGDPFWLRPNPPTSQLDSPALENWQVLNPDRVYIEALPRNRLRIVNRFGGGNFAVQWTPKKPIDLTNSPVLRCPLNIPEGVKISLHIILQKYAFILPLTAPVAETQRILGHPRFRPAALENFYAPPLKSPFVSGTPRPAMNTIFRVNLLKKVKERFPALKQPRLTRLILGNTSQQDYLLEGLHANHADAAYTIGPVRFLSLRAATQPKKGIKHAAD